MTKKKPDVTTKQQPDAPVGAPPIDPHAAALEAHIAAITAAGVDALGRSGPSDPFLGTLIGNIAAALTLLSQRRTTP